MKLYTEPLLDEEWDNILGTKIREVLRARLSECDFSNQTIENLCNFSGKGLLPRGLLRDIPGRGAEVEATQKSDGGPMSIDGVILVPQGCEIIYNSATILFSVKNQYGWEVGVSVPEGRTDRNGTSYLADVWCRKDGELCSSPLGGPSLTQIDDHGAMGAGVPTKVKATMHHVQGMLWDPKKGEAAFSTYWPNGNLKMKAHFIGNVLFSGKGEVSAKIFNQNGGQEKIIYTNREGKYHREPTEGPAFILKSKRADDEKYYVNGEHTTQEGQIKVAGGLKPYTVKHVIRHRDNPFRQFT